MRNRALFHALISLFALGVILLLLPERGREGPRVFGANVDRDCAPWDGPAFTVSIPYSGGSVIRVSIWGAPDIRLPVTYSFPDRTGRTGDALYQPPSGPLQELSGRVFFRSVEAGLPVRGRFELRSPDGETFEGEFEAAWTGAIIACG